MIHTFFQTVDQQLWLDYGGIKRATNLDVLDAVIKETNAEMVVTEIKFAEKGKTKAIYFKVAYKWFSFLYDKKKREMWFGHLGTPPGTGALIIGFREGVQV